MCRHTLQAKSETIIQEPLTQNIKQFSHTTVNMYIDIQTKQTASVYTGEVNDEPNDASPQTGVV